MRTRLILVGGFLGAGKTTLISQIIQHLSLYGTKVGLITNDKAAEVVDTGLLEYSGCIIEELTESSLNCDFYGLTDAISKITNQKQCKLIIAEPAGSCTDISATVIQPLKENFKQSVIVAPLSVLVEPDRLIELLEGKESKFHASVGYIVKKQLDEADIILISKSDQIKSDKLEALKQKARLHWPLTKIFAVSSKTGSEIENWLEEVMYRSDSGKQLSEVDYDIYAEAEAVIGWYNASFQVVGNDTKWRDFLNSLIYLLADGFEMKNTTVEHIKILIKDSKQYLIANMTGTNKTISIRGDLSISEKVKMTINARVELSFAELEDLINTALFRVCKNEISCVTIAAQCLTPERPNPTYRYNYIV